MGRMVLLAVLVAALWGWVWQTRAPAPYDVPDGLGVVGTVAHLAALHEHGWDDQVSPGEMDGIAGHRTIRSTCGYVSPWVVEVLHREGYEARVVQTLTLDRWNDENNGHTMVGAKVDGRWVLFDVDRDVWYWRDGQPLSLDGLVTAVADGDYEIRALSGDPYDEAAIRADNVRLMQVPAIRDGDTLWYHSTNPERVEEYPGDWRQLPEAEWRERFYS